MKTLLYIFSVVVTGLWSGVYSTNAQVNVTQFHNHDSRDGLYVDSAFTQGAAANLARDLNFDGTISGNVYAQPLYIDDGAGGRPTIIAVTESNNVYALDAVDGSAAHGQTPTITGMTYNNGRPFLNNTNLAAGTGYTVVMNANAITRSVVIRRDRNVIKTDSSRPYSVQWIPTIIGSHTLSGRPWSQVNGTGIAGTRVVVQYNVVASVSSPTPSPTPNPTPNPTPSPTPSPTPNPTAKKILHWQAGPNTGMVNNVVAHRAYIDTLPFDGIVVRFPDYQACLGPNYTASYGTLYNQIGPIRNQFMHVRHNYASVLIGNSGMTDPFDDWTRTINNFRVLAQVCRDAGLDGILYDNEEYNGHMWSYPGNCRYGSSKTLSQYQEQWRLRGTQAMQAMLAVWPQIKLIVTIGPWRSTSIAPSCHLFQGANNWLGGYFFAGLFVAGTNHVIDGGELYFLRASNFSCSANFTRVTVTQSPISPPLVPSALTATWRAQYNQSFGIYDQDRVGTPDMTYSVLQSTLVNAMPNANELLWNYSENLDWLTQGAGSEGNWQNAVWNARSQLGLPPP